MHVAVAEGTGATTASGVQEHRTLSKRSGGGAGSGRRRRTDARICVGSPRGHSMQPCDFQLSMRFVADMALALLKVRSPGVCGVCGAVHLGSVSCATRISPFSRTDPFQARYCGGEGSAESCKTLPE